MVLVFINDLELEAKEGQSLSELARNENVVVGLNCTGTGYHVLCEFKVLEGASLLNPPTEEEVKWLSKELIDKGFRLGCEARITGQEGSLKVLTLSESVRRQLVRVVSGSDSESSIANVLNTGSNFVQMAISHMMAAPLGIIRASNNGLLPNLELSLKKAGELIREGGKVITGDKATKE
jgi:ferredoxin